MNLVALSIIALAMGHVFSNAVRTLPAMAADVLQRDLGVTADGLAVLTGAFPATFALAMLPVGVALDRWGVKPTALCLLTIAAGGALLAANADGAASMLVAQMVLGIGCSGMLMCPITYAAKNMPAQRFGLWGGIIQAVGNTGMVISASPLAFLVEYSGWRVGFIACAGLAIFAALSVAYVVRETPPDTATRCNLKEDARDVIRLVFSRELRAPIVMAWTSFAVVLGVRGLWGGPWLMEERGLSRLEAGHVLLLCTVALIIGPLLAGMLERRFQTHRGGILAGGHIGAVAAIALMVLGGALSWPVAADAVLLALFGLLISTQVICFALVRAATPPERVGRALSAMNVAFFGGAAIMQSASGLAASIGGIGAALMTFVVAVLISCIVFIMLRVRET
jgi:MFS family permease